LTNPDTLHAAVLPSWKNKTYRSMLSSLRLIVIDEAHTYDGIFGAHVAMIVRRLKSGRLLVNPLHSRPYKSSSSNRHPLLPANCYFRLDLELLQENSTFSSFCQPLDPTSLCRVCCSKWQKIHAPASAASFHNWSSTSSVIATHASAGSGNANGTIDLKT
jgi:DEAD/DEAH box helicase domain-containing protein